MEYVIYTRTNSYDGTKFELVSKPGNRRYSFDKEGNDRIFSIRLTKGEIKLEFPYSYHDQKELIRPTMKNIILDRVFRRERNIFIEELEFISKERGDAESFVEFLKTIIQSKERSDTNGTNKME